LYFSALVEASTALLISFSMLLRVGRKSLEAPDQIKKLILALANISDIFEINGFNCF
jgi:hypothetical protein